MTAVLEDPWRSAPRGPPPTPRWSPGVRVGWRVDTDAVFGFLLFMIMLFASQLGTLGAAALMALTPVYAVLQRGRLWPVLAPRWFLFLPPLLAGLSVLWSEAPAASAKFAVEYGLTVLGALLLAGARTSVRELCGMICSLYNIY